MHSILKNEFRYDTLDSTNEEAKRLIDSGKITETASIVSEEQTKGKGTHGRTWVSPKGAGVYLSIVHVPKKKGFFNQADIYTKSAGIACVEAVKEICELQPRLKPLNDIYAEGKKLGGILIETRLNKNGINALITGIGINTRVACRGKWPLAPTCIEALMLKEKFNNFSKEKLTEKIIEKICFWHNCAFTKEAEKIEETYILYNL